MLNPDFAESWPSPLSSAAPLLVVAFGLMRRTRRNGRHVARIPPPYALELLDVETAPRSSSRLLLGTGEELQSEPPVQIRASAVRVVHLWLALVASQPRARM